MCSQERNKRKNTLLLFLSFLLTKSAQMLKFEQIFFLDLQSNFSAISNKMLPIEFKNLWRDKEKNLKRIEIRRKFSSKSQTEFLNYLGTDFLEMAQIIYAVVNEHLVFLGKCPENKSAYSISALLVYSF